MEMNQGLAVRIDSGRTGDPDRSVSHRDLVPVTRIGERDPPADVVGRGIDSPNRSLLARSRDDPQPAFPESDVTEASLASESRHYLVCRGVDPHELARRTCPYGILRHSKIGDRTRTHIDLGCDRPRIGIETNDVSVLSSCHPDRSGGDCNSEEVLLMKHIHGFASGYIDPEEAPLRCPPRPRPH